MATNQQRISAVLNALKSHLPYTFDDGTVSVTVTSVSQEGNALKVMCSASDSNGPIHLDLPFFYVNPPTGVRQGGLNGTVRSTAADTLQAAKQMVLDTVYLFR